jgi:hypothetical protein
VKVSPLSCLSKGKEYKPVLAPVYFFAANYLGSVRCETPIEADLPIDCTPKCCLRGIRSQGRPKGPPPPAVLRILEFEFLSGKMVGEQSMETWRCRQRSLKCVSANTERIPSRHIFAIGSADRKAGT